MAEIANGSVFSQTDSSNSGALPGITGSSSPALIDNSIQALMGAIKREHDWRNFTVTSSGSANAYVLTYSVAPAAYYTGQAFGFITNFAVTGSATANVNSLGAKTIKKLVSGTKTNLASGDISSGDFVQIVYDGTDMVWVNKGVASVSAASDTVSGIVELATTTETITGTDATRAVTPDALAALWEQGSDVASAGTISLGEGGYFNITGTTTITDIDFATDKAGRKAVLKFAGALTLTHNASTLILPGGANITTAAGDIAEFVSEGSDVVRCTNYQKADGTSVANPTTTPVTIRKATQDTRNTTTLVSDTDFTFSMLANTNYRIRGTWYISLSGTTPGLKIGLSGPASPTSALLTSIIWGGSGLTFAGVPVATGATATVTYTQTGTSADVVVTFDVVWRNGANAGPFAMQLARQNSAGSFTVNTDSIMTYERFT